MRYLIAIGTALFLSGCAGQGPMETAANPVAGPQKALAPYPADWRRRVAEYVKANTRDPESIRDAQLAEPVAEILPANVAHLMPPRWVVCVSFNAKNAMGGHTGRRMYHVALQDGQVHSSHPASEMGETCANPKLGPFPEVNGKRAV